MCRTTSYTHQTKVTLDRGIQVNPNSDSAGARRNFLDRCCGDSSVHILRRTRASHKEMGCATITSLSREGRKLQDMATALEMLLSRYENDGRYL